MLVPPPRSIHISVTSLYGELNRRTVAEVATYEGPSEGQRESSVIHVFVREQSHRRRDGSTLQIIRGRGNRAR